MLFVSGLISRFVVILILPSLLQKIGIGFNFFSAKVYVNLCSQANSLDAIDKPMYSTLDEKRAIIACFFESQIIELTFILNTNSIVN